MAAAAQRQRERASAAAAEAAARRRAPRIVEDDPAPAASKAYERAAKDSDPIASEMRLIREGAAILQAAKEAEAWTAITTMHKSLLEQVRGVRALVAARVDAQESDAEAQARELEAALSEMPEDQRRALLRAV
jgi:hypothetical protein